MHFGSFSMYKGIDNGDHSFFSQTLSPIKRKRESEESDNADKQEKINWPPTVKSKSTLESKRETSQDIQSDAEKSKSEEVSISHRYDTDSSNDQNMTCWRAL